VGGGAACLTARAKTSNCDVKRRISNEIATFCPPCHLGGYFLNGLLARLLVGIMNRKQAKHI
jgi:hypothetical protein